MRRELTFTDSLSLLEVDTRSMAEISRLCKLLKPVEFYMASLKVGFLSMHVGVSKPLFHTS